MTNMFEELKKLSSQGDELTKLLHKKFYGGNKAKTLLAGKGGSAKTSDMLTTIVYLTRNNLGGLVEGYTSLESLNIKTLSELTQKSTEIARLVGGKLDFEGAQRFIEDNLGYKHIKPLSNTAMKQTSRSNLGNIYNIRVNIKNPMTQKEIGEIITVDIPGQVGYVRDMINGINGRFVEQGRVIRAFNIDAPALINELSDIGDKEITMDVAKKMPNGEALIYATHGVNQPISTVANMIIKVHKIDKDFNEENYGPMIDAIGDFIYLMHDKDSGVKRDDIICIGDGDKPFKDVIGIEGLAAPGYIFKVNGFSAVATTNSCYENPGAVAASKVSEGILFNALQESMGIDA